MCRLAVRTVAIVMAVDSCVGDGLTAEQLTRIGIDVWLL
jgi:hypothetical protein